MQDIDTADLHSIAGGNCATDWIADIDAYVLGNLFTTIADALHRFC